MSEAERLATAQELMVSFAERTGVVGERGSRRYLWTDSFAVCNFLGLARTTGEERYRELALALVDAVHHDLGKHREDAARSGWLDGASEAHPTRGGLRIGKPFPERGPDEPMSQRLEWDRDGQYFHYLTKWMAALDLMARATDRATFDLWARELAESAHRAFVYETPGGERRMYWKMSIDLSRPLVSSMGHHDPLDGYVTTLQLRQTASELGRGKGPSLDRALADYRAMLEGRDWATDDPLGLGGLLMDAYRVEQLVRAGAASDDLLEDLLEAALSGLPAYARQHAAGAPASQRLGFRELGLAIGLAAVERLAARLGPPDRFPGVGRAQQLVQSLERYAPLRDDIVSFWLEDEHRRSSTWTEHLDINEVMLATALAPTGCLELPPE